MTNVQNITEAQKKEIIDLINESVKLLGSASAVATRCGVSNAAINLMQQDKYQTKGSDMWLKVAATLGWRSSGWQVVDTTNIRQAYSLLADAQTECLFLPMAEKAGSGKSTTIAKFIQADRTSNVFRIVCRDWSKREFLTKLCQALGINIGNGYKSLDNLLELVIEFFKLRQGRPLLIIDQANSLKPSVLSFLIHLYNECEDEMGVVMAGTEHLQIDIKRGVKYSRKGYDEIDSRFGRSYIHLTGNTLSDCRKICSANGITDKEAQETIYKSCNPINKKIQLQDEQKLISVVEDTRLIKRAIKKHHLLTALNIAS
jgi:hypothetical protein